MQKIVKIEQPEIMVGVIQTFMSEIETTTNILKDLHNPYLTWIYIILQLKAHPLLDLINRRGPSGLYKNNGQSKEIKMGGGYAKPIYKQNDQEYNDRSCFTDDYLPAQWEDCRCTVKIFKGH